MQARSSAETLSADRTVAQRRRQPASPLPLASEASSRAEARGALRNRPRGSPQANYGTTATIPTLDPELAKQLGLDVGGRRQPWPGPPRNKMEAFGVKATADALENLIREGRPNSRAKTAR